MWALILLLACKQEEEQVVVASTAPEVFGGNFEVIPDAGVDEYLHAKYKHLLEQYGPSRIAGKGFLVDEGWCHDYFHYAFVISRLVGIDFVKLASVQSREGVKGVNKVADRVPKKHRNYEELLRIRKLIDLTNAQTVRRTHELFRLFRKPNLSDQEQIDLWISLFHEGYQLRAGVSAPEEFLPEDFPRSYELAELAIVDFQKLAFIELKGGAPALLLLIRTIPFWNNREECFELLRSDKEE